MADYERREEGEAAPVPKLTTFPCVRDCGQRNPRSGHLCPSCMRKAMEAYDVGAGAASAAYVAEAGLGHYAAKSEKFAALVKREQVRILVLSVDPDADVLFATEKERNWAASMRKGIPELGQFLGKDEF